MTNFHYDVIWVAEYAAWILAVAFALWRGDRSARLIAIVYLVGFLAMMPAFGTRPAELAVDVVGLAAMCAVALRGPRPWLLWACAFQLISTATRVAALLDDSIKPLAYATALNTWWMLQLAALAWGTYDAERRRRGTARRLTTSPANRAAGARPGCSSSTRR